MCAVNTTITCVLSNLHHFLWCHYPCHFCAVTTRISCVLSLPLSRVLSQSCHCVLSLPLSLCAVTIPVTVCRLILLMSPDLDVKGEGISWYHGIVVLYDVAVYLVLLKYGSAVLYCTWCYQRSTKYNTVQVPYSVPYSILHSIHVQLVSTYAVITTSLTFCHPYHVR